MMLMVPINPHVSSCVHFKSGAGIKLVKGQTNFLEEIILSEECFRLSFYTLEGRGDDMISVSLCVIVKMKRKCLRAVLIPSKTLRMKL